MRNFYQPPEPFKIFSEPFSFTNCEEAPEFVELWSQKDMGPHRREVRVRRLGLVNDEFVYDNGFDSLPEICLYRLRDVPMYHSLSFSKTGRVFPPSLRYRQDGSVTGFSLPRPINPRPLGGGYFAYLSRPSGSGVEYLEEAAMPFYTFHEYGHYLMESLPSLHFLAIQPNMKLILPPETSELPPYLREMAAPFGLDEKAFIIAGELAVFKDFYLPGRLYMESRYINSPAKAIYERIARYYDGGGRPEKIYLARSGIKNRRLINEAECEEIFRNNGFTVIRPETLPFSEQVRLFARATHVAGPAGTALHNAVFSLNPERLKVLTMIPEGLLVAKNCYSIENAFGRIPETVFGRYLDPDVPGDIRLTFYAPWHIDPKNLAAAIKQWLHP